MESSSLPQAAQAAQATGSYNYYRETKLSMNALVIETSFGGNSEDTNDASINSLFKGLSVTANEIVNKLNELLKSKLPNGIQSLKPEEVTPEATADKIVTGVTGLFDTYAQQHPDLKGEELLNSFMKEVHSGVKKGYDDAYSTLDDLGAFQFDGVKDGVQKTMDLIEKKLQAFEAAKRQEMGLDAQNVAQTVESNVSSGLLAQAGAQVNVVA